MSSQTLWQRASEIFDGAVDLPTEEREAHLDAACGHEPALRREVESLLKAHDRADGIFERTLPRGGLKAPDIPALRPRGTGPYELVCEIGRGGMGVVYEAFDPRLERRLALKVLSLTFEDEGEGRARFMTEARAVSSFDHPNICTVHDVGEAEDGRPFFVMSFYEGKTLAERLRQGPLDIEDARQVAWQVARGLEHAHRAGVVHRDIKPSNLFLTGENDISSDSRSGGTEGLRLKILDFGIARVDGADALTGPGRLVGTVSYMSPEQVLGERMDHRTDLWSLGVVLYELLTGERPFQGKTDLDKLKAVLKDDPEDVTIPRPDVPPRLAAVVHRALAKDPDARYASAAAMAADLETATADAPPDDVTAAPGRLPAPLTSFVGRDTELGRLAKLLRESRFVTLTGPPGTGKTRLALQAAARLAGDFVDGVSFVPLAAASRADQVPGILARALELELSTSRPLMERLVEVLADDERLLVVDNFEHVAAAAGYLVRLLEACPRMRMLATSRGRLKVRGEQVFAVSPLALPEGGAEDAAALERCPSTRLFLDRARAVRAGLTDADEDATAIAEICVHLEGLPLAIELAAARVKLFAPRELLERLRRRLGDLKTGDRDVPERHRTLRQAVDWSYELLPALDRAFFRRLGIFAGGFSLAAAEDVAGRSLDVDVEDAVAELMDQSLLTRLSSTRGEPRFGMLATLREYAFERLAEAGEEDLACRAHDAFFLARAERAAPELTGARPGKWFDRLGDDYDNFLAVFDRHLGGEDVEKARRLAVAFWRYWLVRGPVEEGCEVLERLLEPTRPAGEPRRRADLLGALGFLESLRGQNRSARERLQEALAIRRRHGDPRGRAHDLSVYGWVAALGGDFFGAMEAVEEALEILAETEDRWGLSFALDKLAWIAGFRGECTQARELFARSLAERRATGDDRGIAFELVGLAWAEVWGGAYDAAETNLDEARGILDQVIDHQTRGFLCCVRGMLAHDRGDPQAAREAAEEGLVLRPLMKNPALEAWILNLLGEVLRDLGLEDEARARFAAAQATWHQAEILWGEAWTLCELAALEAAAGNVEEARELYSKSLRARGALDDQRGFAICMERWARLDATARPERSARLLGAASGFRERLGTPLPPRWEGKHRACLKDLADTLGAERRDALLREGADFDVMAAVTIALA